MSGEQKSGVVNAIEEQAELRMFLAKMREFEEAFCKAMYTGEDFTMRFEVRGNKRVLLRARVYTDCAEQLDSSQKRLDKKLKERPVHT